MKYLFVFIAFATLILFPIHAQNSKLKRADDYFEKLSYRLAIDAYTDLLDSKYSSVDLRSKLAFSYYKVEEMEKAEWMYREALKEGELNIDHYFYFSDVLKQLGQYKESNKWMEVFLSKSKESDQRALSYSKNKAYLEKIKESKPHFSIQNFAHNSTYSDYGGYPSIDGEGLYFLSARRDPFIKRYWMWNGLRFWDLYLLKEQSQSLPNMVREVNTKFHEGPICFSPDGQYVYFTRNNISKGSDRKDEKGVQNLKLYYAKIDQNGAWVDIYELRINSKEYSVGHPVISKDGKFLIFASDMPGGFGKADLYRAPILENGDIGNPINLGPKINTEGNDMFPWLGNDGLFYFSSDGHLGLGGLDVFVAALDDKWMSSHLTNVGKPINSQNDDFALIFANNGQTGYFSSNRIGGQGSDDIYSFTMLQPFEFKTQLIGKVFDDVTKLILPNSSVELYNSQGDLLGTTLSDSTGGFTFIIEPEKEYLIKGEKQHYQPDDTTLSTVSNLQEIYYTELYLSKVKKFSFSGLVTDESTGDTLTQAKVIIKDNLNGNVIFENKTDENGSFYGEFMGYEKNQFLNLTITISSNNYFSKSEKVIYQLQQEETNLSAIMDLSIKPMEIGLDLASIIEINPIYFDLAKYNIRKDAAIELDKIVNIMNEYPNLEIELGSHTDCRASIAYNETLSDNRAKSSAEYIRARISNPNRIYGKGYGESRLKVDCPCEGNVKSNCSEEEHQKNRRTEFIIVKF